MFSQRSVLFRSAAAVLSAAVLCGSAAAAQTSAGASCCFSAADFGGGALAGVCITEVPEAGTVLLGDRQVRGGDVLTSSQLDTLTFLAAEGEADSTAVLRYLPIRSGGVDPEAELVISIKGKRDEAPTAEDSKMQTYKNLPNEGLLAAEDPEGQSLTYTLTRAPRRGEVILRDDGSFLYTPKKNKVGTDSFTFTATDPAGNVSREATVTIDILKPSDDARYTDTVSSDCRFEAEWLRSIGLFTGETVNGQLCFAPDKSVTRGQFLAMLMEVLDLPVDRNAEETGFLDESPEWLRPYLAAALRSGIISGYPAGEGVEFRSEQAVTADEAAIMVRNAMDFAIPAAALDGEPIQSISLPSGSEALTRSEAARTLYRLSRLREESGIFSILFD